MYAARYHVSTEEAARRLRLQSSIGALDQALGDLDPDGYGGLWIEHEPSFLVVVAAAAGTEASISDLVDRLSPSYGLFGMTTILKVKRPLSELRVAQLDVADWAHGLGMSTSIDVMGNVARVYPGDSKSDSEASLDDIPDSVEVDGGLFVGRETAYAYAGLSLSSGSCTSGFTLVYTTTNPDTYFTSTAGHCSNSLTLLGSTISYDSEIYGGNFDVQYGNFASGQTPEDWMVVAVNTVRTVTSRVTTTNQPINGWTCKYGNTTKDTCGTLISKSFQPAWIPNSTNVWHQVRPSSGDMVNGGDSGGPVFSGHGAYGIVSGEFGAPWCVCDLIYSAIPWAEANGTNQEKPLHVLYTSP